MNHTEGIRGGVLGDYVVIQHFAGRMLLFSVGKNRFEPPPGRCGGGGQILEDHRIIMLEGVAVVRHRRESRAVALLWTRVFRKEL